MNLTPKLYDAIERKKTEQASFGDAELTRLVGQQYMPMAYYFGSPDVLGRSTRNRGIENRINPRFKSNLKCNYSA